MKVIYEANDGTKFDSKEDCVRYEATESMYEKANLIEELLDEADRDCDSFFYTKRKVTDFIIENIKEINMILGIETKEQVVYTDCFGSEYIAVEEFDRCSGCSGCSFTHGTTECHDAASFFSCGHNKIICVKK